MTEKSKVSLRSVQEMIAPSTFQACLESHGLYHSRQFVLRLSPVNHDHIAKFSGRDVVNMSDIEDAELKAYSTYIHENIHWWQHKGSISGFIRSMSYVSFFHNNFFNVKTLASHVGLKKPLFTWWNDESVRGYYSNTEVDKLANHVINDFMDVEFYLAQSYNPDLLKGIVRNEYFVSQAHSALTTYSLVVNDLSSSICNDDGTFPSTTFWDCEFKRCRENVIAGHNLDAGVYLPPLGLLDVLEGQARMIQLQYLRFRFGGNSLESARREGYLEGEYGKAFDFFLSFTEVEEPADIDAPLVAMFLLICDISLNPDEGFASQISDFENFHNNVDPGYRFMVLCQSFKILGDDVKYSIEDYSKDEYISVSSALCSICGYASPYEISLRISNWSENSPSVSILMGEYSTFKFGQPNSVSRMLFSEFIEFNKDKFISPEFFCWPGIWLSGDKSDVFQPKWMKHLALFSDSGDSSTIIPRCIDGREDDAVETAFNDFYNALILLDLLRQWIISPGCFDTELDWLKDTGDKDEFSAAVISIFEKNFDIKFSEFDFF